MEVQIERSVEVTLQSSQRRDGGDWGRVAGVWLYF